MRDADARILSRTWEADSYLKRVAGELVTDKGSITMLVKHSDLFRHRFASQVERLLTSPTQACRITDLASAKHRYDSNMRPFGRACLYFEALVVTAQTIADERRGQAAGVHATRFLEFIDMEVMVTLGLMADAGDETLILLRFLESEQHEKARLALELGRFLHRVDILFKEKECWQTGYTAHMLDVIRRPVTVFVSGSAKALGAKGGCPSPIKKSALQRLVNWVDLTTNVVRAEFPNFDVLLAFGVFRPSGRNNRDKESVEDFEAPAEQLKRLSSVFRTDRARLRSQLEDHLPVVSRIYNAENFSVIEAWAAALKHTQRTPTMAQAHPVDCLLPMLMRYGALGGTTSGVERLFAEGKAASGIAMRSNNENLYNDLLQLVCDKNPRMDEEIVQEARRVWVEVYGKPRPGKREIRCDSGRQKPRMASTGKPSLAGWIRERRQQVAKVARRFVPSMKRLYTPVERVVGQQGWTASHAAEAIFQRTKRTKRFLEAVADGAITDLTDDTKDLISQYAKIEGRCHKEYVAKQDRIQRLIEPGEKPNLHHKRVHVEANVTIANKNLWHQQLRTHKAVVVTDRTTAELFIVEDVTRIGQRTLWNAMLAGIPVCSVEHFVSEGIRGPVLTYKTAVMSKRQIWCSADFVGAHSELHKILVARSHAAGSNWRWIPTFAKFQDLATRRTVAGHGNEVVGFVTEREAVSEDTPP